MRKSIAVWVAVSWCGLAFAETEVTTVSLPAHKAVAPDVAINARGDIALLWVDRAPQERSGNEDRHIALTDVYAAFSRDGGKTFSMPAKVNDREGAVWGQQVSRPRIVGTASGTWHVAYSANEIHPQLGKTALTMHYTRSIDGGRGFAAPRRLSTLTSQDMSEVIHGGFASAAAFGTITAAPDGSVHVIWIDTRHMQPDSTSGSMYAAVSRDDGTSFVAERQVIETGVCPCCQLTATANEKSDVLIGTRQIQGDNIRPATLVRLEGGAAAEAPIRSEIGGAPWQIAGCPLKPTTIATRGSVVAAAVHNGGESTPGVIFSTSTDGGASFDFHGLVHLEASISDAPSVAINDRQVLLAWHGRVTAGPRKVFYRWYSLTGEPLSAIQQLGEGSGNAQAPSVATRADGRFQIAWQQGDAVLTKILELDQAGS
jgi:hypothetical protein